MVRNYNGVNKTEQNNITILLLQKVGKVSAIGTYMINKCNFC